MKIHRELFNVFLNNILHQNFSPRVPSHTSNSIFLHLEDQSISTIYRKTFSFLILFIFCLHSNWIFRQIQIDFATINISKFVSLYRFCLITRNMHGRAATTSEEFCASKAKKLFFINFSWYFQIFPVLANFCKRSSTKNFPTPLYKYSRRR